MTGMEITLSKSVLLGVVLAPLAGSLIAGLLGRQIGRKGAQYATILGVAVSCALSCWTLYQLLALGASPFNENIYTFFDVGHYSAHVGFMVDRLTAMMMTVVTFVSLLVHVYTIGYMEDDPGYQRFFSYISLFTFSMLTLVMSNNFMQLFFGWEAVGLVSYLLIGFWFKKPTAIFANLKAFVINRVGDFGFLLGIAAVLWVFGTLDYATVFANAPLLKGVAVQILPGHSWQLATLICICLFIGAMAKSAQVPLHVWLPDSMEGPTPISALIHAATMVTAGIFMVTRMSPLFQLSATTMNFMLFIGATTAFFTGLIGIVQYDIKRVVAYSTLSQLGYMFVALGVSAYSAAVFHLMTHAFFKALLFLAAGSVIIGMHHEQDMRKMGGLYRYMPVTYATSLIGTLALVGMPFFSGFYSKDSIIEAAEHHAHVANDWIASYGYWSVLAGVVVTSFYSFRLLFLTFHGKERFHETLAQAHHDHADDHTHVAAVAGEALHDVQHLPGNPSPAVRGHAPVAHATTAHPHESPWVVTLPLVLLAIPSIAIGFFTTGPLLFGTDWSGHHEKLPFFLGIVDLLDPSLDTMAALKEAFHGPLAFALHGFAGLPFWLMLAGLALAALLYLVLSPEWPTRLRRAFAPLVSVLENKYGMDALWIGGFAGGSVRLGKVFRFIDAKIVDGVLVNGSVRVVDLASNLLRRTQSGYLYHYAFAMILGLIVLMAALMRFWH